MIVDLEKAKENFIEYTKNYDLKNENIERKQKHSIRVMNISNEIAKKMNLDEEKIQIATLIGLLHDIARFEQYTQHETFYDLDSFDHGDYGAHILDKDIRKYIKNDKYDEIIKKAVKNHNKFSIEEGLSQEELLFAKIIRDADKLDILYESVDMFWKGQEEKINKSKISETIMQQFEKEQLIKRNKGTHLKNVDNIIGVLAFIFDINFKESFEILKRKDYINKIINRFNFENIETKVKMKKIQKLSNKHIEDKIGE